ncbi:DUF7694 domain-containing protein [Vibrio alginolyticus]|uniref:DUF7694 domain-containing protein n=1 Tax=Vibrio alginolyticus TaxID=663 RepID=UPI001BD5A9B0|nr:hypothetical protein [Vibrio alginolyticus]MBS9903207.1 hypothetical protein [Vibrio alginolyticus]
MKLKPFNKIGHEHLPRYKGSNAPVAVYQSSQYLVQVFNEEDTIIRLTINSVKRRNGSWKDGLTFDELQAVKHAVGFGDRCAVEVYPEDNELVNDANMRHLWVLPERPAFAWTVKNSRRT